MNNGIWIEGSRPPKVAIDIPSCKASVYVLAWCPAAFVVAFWDYNSKEWLEAMHNEILDGVFTVIAWTELPAPPSDISGQAMARAGK